MQNAIKTYIRAPQLLGMISESDVAKRFHPSAVQWLLIRDSTAERMAHPQLAAPIRGLGGARTRNRCIRQILGVESSFKFDILGQEDWTGRRMIADRFRDRRVFCVATPRISGCPSAVTA